MDFNLPETAAAVRAGVAAIGARYDHSYWDRCDQDKRCRQRKSGRNWPRAAGLGYPFRRSSAVAARACSSSR